MGMGMHVSYIFWKWNMNQAAKGDNSFGSIHSLFDRGLLDSHSKDCEPSWSPQPFEVSALLSILGI